jgi:phosphatidylglycerophosphate synthase
MFDRAVRRRIDPSLDRWAARLVAHGYRADQISWVGFGAGLLCMLAVASGSEFTAFLLLLVNRIADGLDGAVARLTQPTDRGAYLDILFDFIFYSGFVCAFALADPGKATAAAFLIFSFVGTGTSFLAHALMAEKRGWAAQSPGKGIAYLGGLTEGTETIAVFLLMLIWSDGFPALAWGFGLLCWLTTLSRVATTLSAFRR